MHAMVAIIIVWTSLDLQGPGSNTTGQHKVD